MTEKSASPKRSPITTHVLDLSRGKPAVSLAIDLEHLSADGVWVQMKQSKTNSDGRIEDLLSPDHGLVPGLYRISFQTEEYFRGLGTACFYPSVSILFEVKSSTEHYHIPLLLSPYGYSTYRGT